MKWWCINLLCLLLFACSSEPADHFRMYVPLGAGDTLFVPKPPRETYMANVGQTFSIQKDCATGDSWQLGAFESERLSLLKTRQRSIRNGKVKRYYYFFEVHEPGGVNLTFTLRTPDSSVTSIERVVIAP